MLRLLALLLPLSLPALGGCALELALDDPPRSVSLPAGETVLPTRWVQDMPLVQVALEGRGPYEFLIDTGSSATILSKRVADEAGLEPLAGVAYAMGAHGDVVGTSDLRRVETLEIGPCRFHDTAVLVLDLEPLRRSFQVPFDGIVGYPMFMETTWTLDYPRRQVVLGTPPLDPPDGREILPLPPRSPRPDLLVPLGDATHRFLLDSGSNDAISLRGGVGEYVFREFPVFAEVTGSISGNLTLARIGRLSDSLRLGEHEIENPLASIDAEGQRIGSRILKHFEITFDPPRDRIRIRRDPAEKVKLDGIRGTGAFVQRYGEHWEVFHVVHATPAERAGLRPGDRVLRRTDVPGEHHDSPRAAVVYRIERDGAERDVRVPVEALVP